jgi:L-Ala-D/L-Glu epimerase
MSVPVRLAARIERWPTAGAFVISRGAKTDVDVVVATVAEGEWRGRGEATAIYYHGETAESVREQILEMTGHIADGAGRADLLTLMPRGAARNALDCALWDLVAKIGGTRAFALAGLPAPAPVVTAYTISLGSPETMAASAKAAARPLLKLKLGGDGDAARIAAVRASVPDAKLIVDANEAWLPDQLEAHLSTCAAQGVALIEQPLPAGHDALLAKIDHPVPICADESLHDRSDLADLRSRYDAINIKLDKAGGLTEALALAAAAEQVGFQLMIGCMVATSLAMAPALLLAGRAAYVDLDGPLLLAKDRPDGLVYEGSRVYPPSPTLWG